MTILTGISLNFCVDKREDALSIAVQSIPGLSGSINIGKNQLDAKPDDPHGSIRFLFDCLAMCYAEEGLTIMSSNLIGVDEATEIKSGTYRAELVVG